MIRNFISLLLISASCMLSAGELAAERYTKVKSGSLQQVHNMTKNYGHYSVDIPVNDTLPVIVLDEDIYRNLNTTATNIALAGKDNKLIPFVIEKLYKWESRINHTPVAGSIVGFTVDRERNEAIIDYKLNSSQIIGKLALHPYSRKKFDKSVTLEFDNQIKVENLKFFNHQDVVDFSRHNFEFAPVKTRNIRIKIAPFAEKHSGNSSLIRQGSKENFSETQIFTDELSLNKIIFYQADTQLYPARELTRIKTFLRKETDKKDSKTYLEFDLGNYPVKELQINSSTENYHRKYTLEFKVTTPNTSEEAILHRFDGTLTPGSKLEFNAIRASKAILTIENNADAPLTDLTCKWTVPQEALIIDPTAELKKFKLYYGGDANKLPDFDFKYYVEKFKGRSYYMLLLGDEEDNPLFKKADLTLSVFIKKCLPYIIAAAAILLALWSFRMMKNISVNQAENND